MKGASGAIGAAAFLAAAWLAAGCHRRPEPPATATLPAARVQVQTVEGRKRVTTEEVVGTVRSRFHAVIEPKISGRIEEFVAAPGQEVKTGALLARLDAREIQARLDQALALREQYTRDAERVGRLLTNNTVSPQEFEAVDSRRRVAAASASEAETMLGYARIVAPFDGIVTRKLAEVGDLATPGKPLLEMDDPKVLRLEADVPEALIGKIRPGTTMPVRVGSVSGELAGTVGEIAPVADPNSRTFQVKLDLPGATGLRAGQFGRVTIPVGENSALRVPASALLQRGQMEIVFVAMNGRAQLRLVKSGKRIGDEWELVSGVSAGEQVIVSDPARLVDGQAIEVGP